MTEVKVIEITIVTAFEVNWLPNDKVFVMNKDKPVGLVKWVAPSHVLDGVVYYKIVVDMDPRAWNFYTMMIDQPIPIVPPFKLHFSRPLGEL